ncbi:MAG TPA: single-stranded DNA-binding protein [Naasia sp.]|jgi:single-strand DNA-binding protein
MAGLPEITMAGTLVADPELRFTPSGAAVCSFNIACNSRRKNDRGEWEDGDATFIRGQVWRQMAENVAESLRKGQRVMVTGELRQRSYETREGEKRTVYEVDATEIGASLKFAVARVEKAGRSGGGERPSGGRSSSYDAPDPWSSAPASGRAVDDEPPF